MDTFQDLVLDKDKVGRDLWRWIYGEVRAAILDGRLKPGMRLPSSRSLSTQYGVARGTVVVAFEQLHAEGYVETERGVGSRVSLEIPSFVPRKSMARDLNTRGVSKRARRCRDVAWMVRRRCFSGNRLDALFEAMSLQSTSFPWSCGLRLRRVS